MRTLRQQGDAIPEFHNALPKRQTAHITENRPQDSLALIGNPLALDFGEREAQRIVNFCTGQ